MLSCFVAPASCHKEHHLPSSLGLGIVRYFVRVGHGSSVFVLGPSLSIQSHDAWQALLAVDFFLMITGFLVAFKFACWDRSTFLALHPALFEFQVIRMGGNINKYTSFQAQWLKCTPEAVTSSVCTPGKPTTHTHIHPGTPHETGSYELVKVAANKQKQKRAEWKINREHQDFYPNFFSVSYLILTITHKLNLLGLINFC